jgi:hypothetical protein
VLQNTTLAGRSRRGADNPLSAPIIAALKDFGRDLNGLIEAQFECGQIHHQLSLLENDGRHEAKLIRSIGPTGKILVVKGIG